MSDSDLVPLSQAKKPDRRKRQKANGADAPVFDPSNPFDTARRLIAEHHTADGARLMHHHDARFWQWTGTHYIEIDAADIRARLYAILSTAIMPGKDQAPFKPTSSKVNNVIDAYRAAANLPSTIAAPAWIEHVPDMPPADDLLPCANGFLHIRDRVLHPTTPLLFIQHALPYAYAEKGAPPARWLRFLNDIWPDDVESVETLREIFGYVLTRDTSQQKIFLIIGPKRSGKGTIARILNALLGAENTVAPTLASLATNFGLAPLIGRQLAVIADARLGARADQAAIAERLLSISGEDGVTIDRKYSSAWTGKLPTRFMILTNELPRLTDNSGALAGRFIVLTLRESFYGREDHALTEKLLSELPGILNWALDGLEQLHRRGCFLPPTSSEEAVQHLEDLGSPVKAFIRDCCAVGPAEEALPVDVYEAWTAWCRANGRDHPGTLQTFGRDLRAALPHLNVRQQRQGDDRPRIYQGISMRWTG
jgi:putative DNA primase/helicase